MEINFDVLSAILDAYPYEVVFVDRNHVIRYLNKAAHTKYDGVIEIGGDLRSCHSERAQRRIEEFLVRADNGEEGEMFQVLNGSTGEREFFVPVRDKEGKVIGYFERHENHWENDYPDEKVEVKHI